MDVKSKTPIELQKELHDLQKQFNDFLYFLPEALLEIDLLVPRLSYMNRMAYILFGYAEADFADGIEISRLFAEQEYERAIAIIKGYVAESLQFKTAYQRSGEQNLYEFLMRKKDGSQFYAETQTSFVLGEDRTPLKMRTLIRDVTSRKRMEEELRESESLYHALFEIVPVGLGIADLQGTLLAFNQAMLQPGGYTREDIARIGNVAFLYYDPADRDKALAMARTQGYLDRHEVKFKRKDGSPYDTLLTLRPIMIKGQRGWQAVVEDITARKHAEELLRQQQEELESRVIERTAELSRANTELEQQITERQQVEVALRQKTAERQAVFEQYRVLFDDNPSMYFTVDVNGVILSVNRFGAEQLGYQVDEMLAQSVVKVFHDEDRGAVQQHLSACLQHPGKIFHWELRKVRKDDSVIWVKEAARSAQDVDGKTIVLIVCEDITETRQLRQKAERMERLAALGQLSTTIAHEIRNPLGSIRLNFQFLAGQPRLAGKLNKTFLNIESGIARIQKIITGILDFSRPIPPALKMTDLHKILDSALHSTRHEFDEAEITVQKDYRASHPNVIVDAGLMAQVFVNLFLNARDAMRARGKLLIRTVVFEKNIAVQIEDNGMGIPPENLEKIYNPFFTTKTDGIGLGLAVVFRILEQHQAQINVESAVGLGTRFTITLPFSPHNPDKPALPQTRAGAKQF